MALEAIYNYQMPAGQELSAVSLSWGLDEAETDPDEMDAADKWMGALLEKVRTLPQLQAETTSVSAALSSTNHHRCMCCAGHAPFQLAAHSNSAEDS